MEIRIETTPEDWEGEAMTMLSQGYHLCTRDNKIFWELEDGETRIN